MGVSVGVNEKFNVGVGVSEPAGFESPGAGVAVGVVVAVSIVKVGVKEGLEDARGVGDASRLEIWGTITAASGLLSSQDWTSIWSIFSMEGTIFVSDEIIFCPEVISTFPAAFLYPHLPSRQQTVIRLVLGSTQTLI